MLEQLLNYPYAFLVPLAIFEGPLVAVACGVGAALGYLNPFIAFAILIGGDVLPDLVYWVLGRWGSTMAWVRRVATRVTILREHLPSLEELWFKRTLSTFLTVKLAWGISAPFVVSAGLSGLPLRRFLMASIILSVPYLGALMGVGYGMTVAYGALSISRTEAETVISVLGFICFVALLAMVHLARRRLSPNEMRKLRERSNIILPER